MPPKASKPAPLAGVSDKVKETIQFAQAAGSLLSTSVSVSILKESFVKACIYGRNRSGKTTLASYFPGPVLFISCEPDANGGATSVTDRPGVFLQRVSDRLLGQDRCGAWVNADDPLCVRADTVKGADKVVCLANELARGGHPFKTVVLDTITSLQDVILCELMGLTKVPEMMSWGMVPDGMYQQRAEKLREHVRPLLNLQNCNVVILAQEKDHNASEDRGGKNKLLHTMQMGSFYAPALGATNSQWLQDACGYVVQIYEDELTQEVVMPSFGGSEQTTQRVGTGKRQRHLRLLYHPNFAAGGRWQWDRDTPEFVTAPSPRELYEAMTRYIPSLKV